jgi:hypothetical protein
VTDTMRKQQIILILIILLICYNIFFSCSKKNNSSVNSTDLECPEPGKFLISGVEVHAVERKISGSVANDFYSDTLTYWIRFDIITKYKEIMGKLSEIFYLNSQCNPGEILNLTVREKTRFYFDKSIFFKGEVIPAFTNLLQYQEFDGSTYNVSVSELSPFAIKSATIKRDFVIPPDNYQVFFEWTSTRDEVFSDTVKVYINVKL